MKGISKMAIQEFVPTVTQNRFAFDFLHDELDTLLALSITLMNRLEDQSEDGDTTSWRLAQVLNDRLASTAFTNNMRTLLTGEKLN
jgi:hypothetical protein